jgi:chromosome segregation ATPase
MAKYVQYLFNLQHNISRIVIEHRPRLDVYEEQAIRTSLELERLGHENHILCQKTLGSAEKDLELQVAYRRLSEAEHGLNVARSQLDLTREEVETWTHVIVHLENAVETQDAEIGEMAEQITTLEQQVQVLQLQVSPAPEDPNEPNAMSGIDED